MLKRKNKGGILRIQDLEQLKEELLASTRRSASSSRTGGMSHRQISVSLPDVVASGTVDVGILACHNAKKIDCVSLVYPTTPSVAASGTLTCQLKKVSGTGLPVDLGSPLDMTAMVDKIPSRIFQSTSENLREDDFIFLTMSSSGVSIINGSVGVVSVSYQTLK